MQVISWVVAGKSGSKNKKALWKSLQTSGFSVQEFVVSGAPGDKFDSNFYMRLPADSCAIVIEAGEFMQVKNFLVGLHQKQSEHLSASPVLWLPSKEVSEEDLLASAKEGVHDWVSLETSAHDWSARLTARIREADVRKRLDAERQVHALRDAKSETILKQREEFLSVCAHDLRSPLGLIQSCVTMILNAKGVEQTLIPLHLDLLQRAKRQATQAISLVNDLLDVMSFEQGLKPQYQLLRLDDFLRQFHKDYSMEAHEKKIQFHYANPCSDWRVFFDSDRIQQVLSNLFANALKFTEAGKNIYLEVLPFTGRRKSDPKFPMLVVSLRDEGKGIPASEIQKIFDRFTQVKDYGRAEGRGLGLTVAKQISNLHDGNIWVESEPGKGSTFFVMFPHVVSRATPAPAEEWAKQTVIIAEPQEGRRPEYEKIISELGLTPIFVNDGLEAAEQAFDILPAAVILTPNLTKLEEAEVANILKGDLITAHIRVLLATEISVGRNKSPTDGIYDGFLRLPLQAEDLKMQLLAARALKAA